MGSILGKKVQNSDKNIDIKSLGLNKIFVGCWNGSLIEFSIIENKIMYDYSCKICDREITSMAKTSDNKTQYVCDYNGDTKEIDIRTHKQVKNFQVNNAVYCVVTHDNKSLIIAECGKNCWLTKWSIRSKKKLDSWQSVVDARVYSQSVSQDNRYQLIGYVKGILGIFDLQSHKTLKNINFLSEAIFGVTFSRDNQNACIGDNNGLFKMIKWKADAKSGDDFHFTKKSNNVGHFPSGAMCLTKDDKYLLVGSSKYVCVFENKTRKVKKKFKLKSNIQGISLVQDGKKAIIAESNGNLSIVDLETLEMSLIAENITRGISLNKIIVI